MGVLNGVNGSNKVTLATLIDNPGFNIAVLSYDIANAVESGQLTELAQNALTASHSESQGGVGSVAMAQLVSFHVLDNTQFGLLATDRLTGNEVLRKLAPVNIRVTDRARVRVEKWDNSYKGLSTQIDVDWRSVFGLVAQYFAQQQGVQNKDEQHAVKLVATHILSMFVKYGDELVEDKDKLRAITKGQTVDSFLNFNPESSAYDDITSFAEFCAVHNVVSSQPAPELSE